MHLPHYLSWLSPVLYLCLIVVLLYLFFRWFERANVWAPRRALVADPSEIGLHHDEVFLTTPDDVNIQAWYIPHPNARGSLLFCHGNGGNISHRLESIRQFHSFQMNIMIFSYRGYGKSEGRLSEAGTYTDAQTAFEWLKKKTPDLPIVIFGRSLGAAVAAELAARVDAAALVFESGFTSIGDMGRERFPFLPVSWINTIEYDSLSKIDQINMPVLVIHSPEDDIVPYHHGEAVFEMANEPKEMIQLRGTHNEGHFLYETEYLRKIKGFLNEYVFQKNNNHDKIK